MLCSLAPLCLLGCLDQGAAPVGLEPVRFTPFETREFTTTEMSDSKPSLPPQQQEQLDTLIATFAPKAPAFLQSPEAMARIEGIEQAYLQTGRVFELIELYHRDIAQHGANHSLAAPRLLWLYIRLAQDTEARELLASLLRAQPENPDVWFLYGAYWIKEAKESKEAATKFILGWSKALELDPDYTGFEKITADILRREVGSFMLRTPVAPAELQALEQELTGLPPEPSRSDAPAEAPPENP